MSLAIALNRIMYLSMSLAVARLNKIMYLSMSLAIAFE